MKKIFVILALVIVLLAITGCNITSKTITTLELKENPITTTTTAVHGWTPIQWTLLDLNDSPTEANLASALKGKVYVTYSISVVEQQAVLSMKIYNLYRWKKLTSLTFYPLLRTNDGRVILGPETREIFSINTREYVEITYNISIDENYHIDKDNIVLYIKSATFGR
jgi:hypothetical protein